jgi:hypothetical protein
MWDNYLWERWEMVGGFGMILAVNAYFMLTTGKRPGFYEKKVTEEERVMLVVYNDSFSFNNSSNSTLN